MQAYDSEFERISKDILSKKKALEKLIEETRTELNASLDSVSTDVNIRITELEEKLENRIDDIQSDVVSSESLGKLLIDLGKKVQKK
jgi:archaellum component FlaC